MNKHRRIFLQLISLLIGCASILTAIPHSSASSPSILGYYAVCPFSPVSTIITLYISVTTYRYLANIKIINQ